MFSVEFGPSAPRNFRLDLLSGRESKDIAWRNDMFLLMATLGKSFACVGSDLLSLSSLTGG